MFYYLVITFLLLILVMFLPQILSFVFLLWLVLTIVRALFPKENRYNERRQESYQKQKRYQEPSRNGDIIDVEYREREVDEENRK